MKEQVNVKFERDLITQIDVFLANNRGKYSDRSELIGKILSDFLKNVGSNSSIELEDWNEVEK